MSNDAMKCLKAHFFGEGSSEGDSNINHKLSYLGYYSQDENDFSARKVFLFWYRKEQGYDYTREPEKNDEGTLIITEN